MPGSEPPAAWRLLACLAALALASAVPAHGQALDRGAFTLYQEGVRIGEERFVIRQERGGAQRMIVARGELNLKTDGETLRVRIALEAGGPNLTPRRYEAEFDGAETTEILGMGELNLKTDGETLRVRIALEVGGSDLVPRRYEAEFDGAETTEILGIVRRDRLRINERTSQGEQIRQFLPGATWTILEQRVAHHYWFVARLIAGGATRIAAIVPRGAGQMTLRVEDRGTEATSVGQRRMELRHLVLSTGAGQPHHVWLDGERVMKVEVHATGWSAIRSDTGTQSNQRAGGAR